MPDKNNSNSALHSGLTRLEITTVTDGSLKRFWGCDMTDFPLILIMETEVKLEKNSNYLLPSSVVEKQKIAHALSHPISK
jgi:hypothetical protein